MTYGINHTKGSLTAAAQRAGHIGRSGATAAQVYRLADLLDAQNLDHTWLIGRSTNAILTAKQASAYISDLESRNTQQVEFKVVNCPKCNNDFVNSLGTDSVPTHPFCR